MYFLVWCMAAFFSCSYFTVFLCKVIQDNSTSEEDASLQVVAGASVENQHKPSLETIYAAVKKPKPKPKPKPRLLLPVTVRLVTCWGCLPFWIS